MTATGRRSVRDWRRPAFVGLYVPPALVLGAFLVAPLVFIIVLSVRPDLSGALIGPFDPTLRHFAAFAESAGFGRLLLTSMLMAAGVALMATILAFPVAYYLRFHAGRRAAVLLLLLLLPFWTSFLLRVMAWKLMLGSEGVINSFLLSVGLVEEPISALLYNRGSVIVALVYVWMPFAALPILAALQRVDTGLLDAGADLYASPLARFVRVTLPLAAPGAIAAFFMVFIPTVGEYATPLLVGGPSGTMYGNIIQDFFTRAANWPYGAALSVIMLGSTFLFAAIGLRLVNVRRFLPRS